MHLLTMTDVRQWISERYDLDDDGVEKFARFVWNDIHHPVTIERLENFADMVDHIVYKFAEKQGE